MIEPRIRISFLFAWFDLWIGLYFDKKNHILYICPIPCCVIKLEITPRGRYWIRKLTAHPGNPAKNAGQDQEGKEE
jgi:hypothetical protein